MSGLPFCMSWPFLLMQVSQLATNSRMSSSWFGHQDHESTVIFQIYAAQIYAGFGKKSKNLSSKNFPNLCRFFAESLFSEKNCSSYLKKLVILSCSSGLWTFFSREFEQEPVLERVGDVSEKTTFPRGDVSEKLTFPRLSETSVSRKRRFRGNISLWKFRMLYLKNINRRTNPPGRKWSEEDKLKFFKLTETPVSEKLRIFYQ